MKRILLMILIVNSVLAMDKPPLGSKRGFQGLLQAAEEAKVARSESESENELPTTASERLEPVSSELVSISPTGLQDLPNELLAKITSLITNAKGNTNDQKLISAAIDINNFAVINKAFREFFKSDYVQLLIIKELAQRYAHGDEYAAAFALATNEASAMIGATINDLIGYDNDNEDELKDLNPYVLERFKEHLADAIKRKKEDAWRFYTRHINPAKLAFIIDNLTIDGLPALHYVIDTNNKEMLGKVLAVTDINYNIVDDLHRTPLMVAIITRNTDLIRFLIEQDVNVNIADDNEDTPLAKAVSIGNLEYVNLLLDENALVNTINDNEYTPLMIAILNTNIPIIQRLLQVPGIDVNMTGDPQEFDGITTSALHYAAQLGNEQIMALLLRAPQIQLNILNNDGQTPLHTAAIEKKDKMVNQLIRAGAQVNIQDAQGMTPLMYAAREDQPLSVYYLINPPANADLTLTDAQGHTALWHARNANEPANSVILQNAQAPE